MKKKKIITLAVGILIGVFMLYAINFFPEDNINEEEEPDGDDFDPVTTGSTGPGDSEIMLTPEKVGDGELVFSISINTHTVSLEEHDLGDQSYLKLEGEKFEPVEYPTLSGHHVNGELVFDIENNQEPESFEVSINGIPDVDERVFKW